MNFLGHRKSNLKEFNFMALLVEPCTSFNYALAYSMMGFIGQEQDIFADRFLTHTLKKVTKNATCTQNKQDFLRQGSQT